MTYTRSLLRSTCYVLLAGLSACNYLIPEDQSALRYNTVNGDRHRPVRNVIAPSDAPSSKFDRESMATPAPVTPVAARELPHEQPVAQNVPAPMPLPPVDAAVQAKANAQIAKDPSLGAAASRQVPVENREFTLAENSGLMNVPPHPANSGPDSAGARLDDARRDLEQSRADAVSAKAQLNRDVAAEPSAFPEMKLAPLPAPAPSSSPVPQQGMHSEVTPPPSYIAAVDLTPPPPPAPKPVAAASTTPAPVLVSTPITVADATPARSFNPMTPVPPAAPTYQPIQLTPPTSAQAMATAPVTAPARASAPAALTALPPTSSDFNPLAGSQVATANYGSEANMGYLPVSRYASRR